MAWSRAGILCGADEIARRPRGLAFGPDGALFALHGGSALTRLALGTDGRATAVRTVAGYFDEADSVAFDALGRIYVTERGGGPRTQNLTVFEAEGTGRTMLMWIANPPGAFPAILDVVQSGAWHMNARARWRNSSSTLSGMARCRYLG